MSQGEADPHSLTVQEQLAQSVTQEVFRVGAKMTDKALDIKPTITLNSGTKINVFATSDIVLKPYRS
jgi:type IV secretory pathway VirB10-like protein